MSSADCVVPEFFVSKLDHAEDCRDGTVRFWYCVERTNPDGVREKDIVCTIIMPIAALPDAIAKRKLLLGTITEIAKAHPDPRVMALLQ